MHPIAKPLPTLALALAIACWADLTWPTPRILLTMAALPGLVAVALAARRDLPHWRHALAILMAPTILTLHPHHTPHPLPRDAELSATIVGAPTLRRDTTRVRVGAVTLDGEHLPPHSTLELDVPLDLSPPDVMLPGASVRTFVLLSPHPRPQLPWERDRRSVLLRRGVLGRAYAKEPVVALGQATSPWKRVHASMVARRVDLEQRVRALMGDEAAAYILAMTLGSKGLLSDTQRRPFVDTGTAHVLAISGLHLGALSVLLWWAARPLTRCRLRSLARRGRWG
ncbi:MAG: ComEC/Rec2 family competence protein [Myxococcota bacterium]